jgi:hypothetical protein
MASGPVLYIVLREAENNHDEHLWHARVRHITHYRSMQSWTSLYLSLHAQTTETMRPVAQSAKSAQIFSFQEILCESDERQTFDDFVAFF